MKLTCQCGKSSYVTRFVEDTFNDAEEPTIGKYGVFPSF